MAICDLIKTKEELTDIAEALANEIRNPEDITVSRYVSSVTDGVQFINGRRIEYQVLGTNLNKEKMTAGIYTQAPVGMVFQHSMTEAIVARDLHPERYHFDRKGIALPSNQQVFYENIPTGLDCYDAELRQFTKDYPMTKVERRLTIEQQIVVNSQGGVAIQSVPFFTVSFEHGYEPIPLHRALTAVCTTQEDVRRFPSLLRYLADPTMDGRVRNAASFPEAFAELHKIAPLRYGSLEDAGIPLRGLYDVVVLTGVPAHEVFGHHFEEPVEFLNFGDSATFKSQQKIENKGIVLKDDPRQTVAGFRVRGFTYFDAYGRSREARTHIKDGLCQEFLGSEYIDQEKLKQYLHLERSPFVGNASQSEDGFFPQPRMSCTVLDGETTNIDLEGKVLIVSHSGHTNPHDKTYLVNAQECYVMREGVPQRVIPLKVTGGIHQALANMELLPDWNYNAGFCWKPQPFPQFQAKAVVPLSQFCRSQLWRQQQVYPLPVSETHLRMLIK